MSYLYPCMYIQAYFLHISVDMENVHECSHVCEQPVNKILSIRFTSFCFDLAVQLS